MKQPVEATIFDVDSTLIDSGDFHAIAWVDAFAEFCVTETSSDDVEESKPDPSIFHAAVRQFHGIAKNRMIVSDDSPDDAEASTKAGLRSIGVLCGGFPPSSLTKGGCSVIYRSPSNILINYETIYAR